MLLARKTKISKWVRAAEMCQGDINNLCADTITSELRTSRNTLSTWVVNIGSDNLPCVKEVVLALITGSKVAKIESFDLVLIDTETANQFEFDGKELGDTGIEALKNKHYNICNINYKQLGEISSLFISQVKNEKFCKISKKQIISIMKEAKSANIISLDNFNEQVRDEVARLIQ